MVVRPLFTLLVLLLGLLAPALSPRAARARQSGPVAGRAGRIPAYNPLRDSGHEGGDFVSERVKPAATPLSPCDDLEAKTTLYKTFLDNHRGFPENQKAAYEAGKEYVSRYDRCPEEKDKNVVGYIRPWLAKYEAAVRIWEGSQRRRGQQP